MDGRVEYVCMYVCYMYLRMGGRTSSMFVRIGYSSAEASYNQSINSHTENPLTRYDWTRQDKKTTT